MINNFYLHNLKQQSNVIKVEKTTLIDINIVVVLHSIILHSIFIDLSFIEQSLKMQKYPHISIFHIYPYPHIFLHLYNFVLLMISYWLIVGTSEQLYSITKQQQTITFISDEPDIYLYFNLTRIGIEQVQEMPIK